MRLGVLATHPIQYHAPLYRELARQLELHVYFAHRQSATDQAAAGFGVAFEWDVDLLAGYEHTFLTNRATNPSTDTFSGCDTPDIAQVIAQERFDAFLVTGWYTRSHWQAIHACWRTRTPLFVRGDSHLGTPRSALRQAAKSVAYRVFIPRFDAYLTVGENNRKYYLHYGADPERMFATPHFVDTDFFARASAIARQDRPALRETYGLRPDSRVLLFAGKFIDVKRPLDFVRAVAQLAEHDESVEGVMVGDGPLRADVEAAISQTRAPIRLLGFQNQSEMPTMYALADALALPSEHETWGLVANEAQACGLPVIATDAVGCAPDLIDEIRTGCTFPVGDLDAFTQASALMLSQASDRETQDALRAITERHSLECAVEGVIAALTTVTQATPTRSLPH